MADEWSAFNPQPAPQAASDPWAAFNPQSRPDASDKPPLPQAFIDRVQDGQMLDQAVTKQHGRGVFDILLGINGPRYQLWPERMVRSALSLPHDVATGEVGTGLTVRPQDITDERDPEDEVIQRVQDMASLAVLGEMPKAAPLRQIDPTLNSYARLTKNPDGSLRTQVVGSPPKDPDFKNAATVLNSDAAESNLRTLWEERGIHPAEAYHDAQNDAFLKQDLTTPAEHPRDESGAPAVQNSPVPAGTPRTVLAQTGEAHIDSILESPVTRRNIDNPVIDDTHDVPYAAGGSVPLEDPTVFIDRHFPRSMTIDGVTFDPAEPFTVHENVEQHVMELLTKGGMDEQTAYKVAHFEFAEKAEGAWYRAHGIDQAKAEAAYRPFIDAIQHENPANPPPNLYKKPYPHDDVRAAKGEPLAEPKPNKTMIAQAKAILESAAAKETPLRAAGADVTRDMPDLTQQPAPTPGRLVTAAQDTLNKLFDIGRDAQMLVTPMATGTRDSMALAKDFANSLRRNRWEWSRVDTDIEKRFTPEQRKRMWDAADEESVALQLGESREHQGFVTLEPQERAAVEDLQGRAQMAWGRARDLGMVEGEGLPAYTPRMVINTAYAEGGKALPLNVIGRNLRVTTPQLRHRAFMTAEETEAAAKKALGEQAQIARDIRVLPLATAKLEDAIAGRTLIENIKEIGKRSGDDTVTEGGKPSGSEYGWFTMDHPAFRTWRPKFEEVDGKVQAATDANGNTIFQQVPIYVRSDFEGPLRAVLTQKTGALYGSLMSLKGKTMSLIMNSPLIHNAVEWGRALPAMPGKVASFKIYFEGNRAKNDVATMKEAIDNGLVPIGKRFFNQDITSIMEEPNLAPGRSWTAKILGFVPGLFDEAAGAAVKSKIDQAGDFWHNTLLWDRVADLQAGLYVNFRDELTAKGVDRQTSARAAAHWANRYAGALPQEAMSDGARKIANMLLFSRTFTLGNVGAIKDMLTGLPKDVIAQIERDAGFREGAINEAGELGGPATEAVKFAKSMARRKAMAVVALDMGLFYVGNSLLQSAMNAMLGDSTLDKEMHGYAQRLSDALTKTREHPLSLLQPFNFLQSLSSTSTNEPARQDRILVGYAKDRTAIYARNPAGKIGEEFQGYLTGPLDMIRRKLGTIARPAWQIMANDKGFGRKIYDTNADTPAKYLKNLGLIAEHLAKSQVPEGQFNAFSDLVKGEGDAKVNALQAFGPVAGVTFSKGAPGGPAVGELFRAKEMHNYAVDAELPDIRRQILRGDITGADQRMNALGIPAGLQRFYKRTTLYPATRLSGRTLRDFYQYSTPEQRQRLEAARSSTP